MEGIYLIDKPEGITSFDVVRQLRKILKTKEIGHAGTLDPMATGLLVVLVGRATKLSNLLLEKDKVYLAQITFGASTDTYDRMGKTNKVLETFELTQDQLESAIDTIKSMNKQLPPKYAAIKVDGKKLYEYARNNETVVIESRDIRIHQFDINHRLENNKFGALISVSKGTYIRSIANDLGEMLGIPSHLSELRRVMSGSFSVKDAVKLEEMTQETLPFISLVEYANTLEKVVVEDYMVPLIKNGIRLDERQTTIDGPFTAVDQTGHPLAIYQKDVKNYKPIIQLGV